MSNKKSKTALAAVADQAAASEETKTDEKTDPAPATEDLRALAARLRAEAEIAEQRADCQENEARLPAIFKAALAGTATVTYPATPRNARRRVMIEYDVDTLPPCTA